MASGRGSTGAARDSATVPGDEDQPAPDESAGGGEGDDEAMPPSSVHFNGSVNLPDAETVMREISSRIPTGVRRMTDGETGERNYWIHFQTRKLEQMPEFEAVSVGQAY